MPSSTATQPIAAYAGSNKDRQSIGLPGHCNQCAAKGHVLAHPEFGCGDVGCNSAHDTNEPAKHAESDARDLMVLLVGADELDGPAVINGLGTIAGRLGYDHISLQADPVPGGPSLHDQVEAADVLLVEVSQDSLLVGLAMAWAADAGIPIIAAYRVGTRRPTALTALTTVQATVVVYDSLRGLGSEVLHVLNKLRNR